MKTWKEIKKGDVIYYYDHCKYHKQIVKDIKEQNQTESFVDWFGKKHERTWTRFMVFAGRSCFEVSDYRKDCSMCWGNGMKRFTCKEAYKEHEDKMISKLKTRYQKAKAKYDRALRILNNHGIEIV